MATKKMLDKAKKIGLEVDDTMTDDEITLLIEQNNEKEMAEAFEDKTEKDKFYVKFKNKEFVVYERREMYDIPVAFFEEQELADKFIKERA